MKVRKQAENQLLYLRIVTVAMARIRNLLQLFKILETQQTTSNSAHKISTNNWLNIVEDHCNPHENYVTS